MKNSFKILLTGFMVLMAGCSMVTVRYDYHTKTDFSKFHAFGFMKPVEKFNQNEILVDRIQGVTSGILQNKGFKESPDNPDLLIAVHTRRRETVDTSAYAYS